MLTANHSTLAGQILEVNIRVPKDKTKNASAVLTLQYGPARSLSHREVEFINALRIRIPSYSFGGYASKIEAMEWALKNHDAFVEKFGREPKFSVITQCHNQGILRATGPRALGMGDQIESEIVVDKITFDDDWDAVYRAVFKDRPAPAAPAADASAGENEAAPE